MARSGRDDINQRINLTGDDHVKRQLQQLGQAGDQAFRQLEAGSETAALSITASLSRAFATLSKSIAPVAVATGNVAASFTAAEASVSRFIPHIGTLTAALGVSVSAFGAFKLAKDAAFATNDLQDTANNLGITTEQLEAFRLAARSGGQDVDIAVKALGRMNVATAEAALAQKGATVEFNTSATALRGSEGAMQNSAGVATLLRGNLDNLRDSYQGAVNVLRPGGKVIEGTSNALQQLAGIAGLSVVELNKLNAFDRFLALAKALEQVKDATVQNKLANDLFGKGWRELIPLVEGGGKSIRASLQQIQKDGTAINDKDKGFAAGFIKSFALVERNVGAVMTFLGNTIGQLLIPAFDALSQVITANFASIRQWATEIGTAAVPIIKDFITLISNMGKPLQEQATLQTTFVQNLVSTFQTIRSAARGLVSAFQFLAGLVDTILIPFNALFGTQITGNIVLATTAVLAFIGAFSALGSIVVLMGSLVGLFTAVAALVGWPIVLLAGLVAAGVALLSFTDAWSNLTSTAAAFWVLLKALAGWITDTFFGVLDALAQKTNASKTAVDDLRKATQPGGAFSGDPSIPAMPLAAGGLVPGSGIGDSVRALLTPGEFVIRKPVVNAVGLDWLSRLNGSLLPRTRNRFNTGGLVAAGATGAGGAPVHLHLGGNTFALMGDRGVVEALTRAARKSSLLSAGRKPSTA